MLTIAAPVVALLQDHSRACYPSEAIAILFARSGTEHAETMVKLDNQADRLHALDPLEYPRTSREWFSPNEAKMMRVVREHEVQGWQWVAQVHSHIDCGAYFSAEDKAYAAPDGHPPYPQVYQVVIETRANLIAIARAFRWDGSDFAEIATYPAFARVG